MEWFSSFQHFSRPQPCLCCSCRQVDDYQDIGGVVVYDLSDCDGSVLRCSVRYRRSRNCRVCPLSLYRSRNCRAWDLKSDITLAALIWRTVYWFLVAVAWDHSVWVAVIVVGMLGLIYRGVRAGTVAPGVSGRDIALAASI